MERNILSEEDLFQEDEDILVKLNMCKDNDIVSALGDLNYSMRVIEDPESYELCIYSKARPVSLIHWFS